MSMSKKFVFALIVFGCVAKVFAAPVKDRKVAEAEAAIEAEEVEFVKQKVVIPGKSFELCVVIGLIATVVFTIVKILRVLFKKYTDWKDHRENLKAQKQLQMKLEEQFILKRFFHDTKTFVAHQSGTSVAIT